MLIPNLKVDSYYKNKVILLSDYSFIMSKRVELRKRIVLAYDPLKTIALILMQ